MQMIDLSLIKDLLVTTPCMEKRNHSSYKSHKLDFWKIVSFQGPHDVPAFWRFRYFPLDLPFQIYLERCWRKDNFDQEMTSKSFDLLYIFMKTRFVGYRVFYVFRAAFQHHVLTIPIQQNCPFPIGISIGLPHHILLTPISERQAIGMCVHSKYLLCLDPPSLPWYSIRTPIRPSPFTTWDCS